MITSRLACCSGSKNDYGLVTRVYLHHHLNDVLYYALLAFVLQTVQGFLRNCNCVVRALLKEVIELSDRHKLGVYVSEEDELCTLDSSSRSAKEVRMSHITSCFKMTPLLL